MKDGNKIAEEYAGILKVISTHLTLRQKRWLDDTARSKGLKSAELLRNIIDEAIERDAAEQKDRVSA